MEELIELIKLSGNTITVNRNQILKTKESIDTNLYYVVSGSLRVFALDGEEEQIIRFGYKENLVVSLDSFFTGKPSNLFIQALKKTVIKVIPKTQIDMLINTRSNVFLWTAILEKLVIEQMEREIDILTRSPKDRFHRVLKRSPQLFKKFQIDT
jgi:CRP-like cAMP-binding protein